MVGASATPGRVGRIILELLLGGRRPVYPVHPTEREILGKPVYSRIDDLPGDVDLAVIAMGAERATAAAEQCCARGIPFVIPVAGGFGEIGERGRALEARLVAAASRSGSRILGPNTLGILAPHLELDTLFVDHPRDLLAPGGGVAFITQSGSVGTEALAVAAAIGFGLRAFVGLGNACDLDAIDMVTHFAEDGGASCVALYSETFTDGRAFVEACRKASQRKPVVALKTGRTAAGARAASSHTGRLAGSDALVTGAFRQHGIQRALDEEHLFDAARTLAFAPEPAGPRVAVVTPGGGYGVLAADLIEATDGWPALEMTELSRNTEKRLRDALPAFASAKNPVDITASATDDMFVAALEAVLDDPAVDMVLCIALFAPPGITDALVERIAALERQRDKPLLLVAQRGSQTNEVLRRFFASGAIGFPSTHRGVRAARALWERALLRRRLGGEA